MKKKKIIILLIIVAIVIICFIFIKPIRHNIEVTYCEKVLNDFYNLEESSENSKFYDDDMKYYLSLPKKEYNISKFVYLYLKQISDNIDQAYEFLDADSYITIYCDNDYSRYIDKKNVKIEEIIKELEKIFVHKSDDIYKDWYMPANSKEEVDMPLGYYYIYEKSDYKKLGDIKKVSNFKFTEEIDFDKSKAYGCSMEVEYIDGSKKIIEDKIIYFDDGKFNPYLRGIYFSEDHKASITLHNHDSDEYWLRPDSF